MCSTFKFLAVAFVLARVDRGEERLDRRITFTEQDLVTYSPVTKERVGATGMTIAELCDAAITVSDNAAGNLLLASFGGPPALTAYARSLGDEVTRLDRIETDLNEATPGDPRDTTTPTAMAENVRRLVVGDALSAPSRERLKALLIANKTGDARLRAGFPKTWSVRRQDRDRRSQHDERYRHRLATRSCAHHRIRLLCRISGVARRSICGAGGRRTNRRRGRVIPAWT